MSVGTPHFSITEFARLVDLLGVDRVAVDLYVSTSRAVLTEVEARGWLDILQRAGVTTVTDTCTYVTPILRRPEGPVVTNSAKWAYYAPGNLGVEVAFASLDECVAAAVSGVLAWDEELWRDD